MTQYSYLAAAIAVEVVATLILRVAAGGRPILYTAVIAGYATAFVFLSAALRQGMSLGIAYGIWAASGVALTAIGSKIVFGESLSRRMVGGISLIIVGVLIVEVGATH